MLRVSSILYASETYHSITETQLRNIEKIKEEYQEDNENKEKLSKYIWRRGSGQPDSK